MPVGGGNKTICFRLKSDHTQIQNAAGSAAATSHTDAAMKFGWKSGNDILEQTDIKYAEDGSVAITFNVVKFDSDWYTFEQLFMPRKSTGSSSSTEEKSDEEGRKIGGASGSGSEQMALVEVYGAIGDDGKRAVGLYPGYFKKTNQRTQKANSWIANQIEFQSVAAKVDIGVAAALIDSTLVSSPSLTSIPADYHEKIAFFNASA